MKNSKLVTLLVSLILLVIGVYFVGTFKNGICYGDIILGNLGLKSWSLGTQGTHYTVFYSLIFFIPSIIGLTYSFQKDYNNLQLVSKKGEDND